MIHRWARETINELAELSRQPGTDGLETRWNQSLEGADLTPDGRKYADECTDLALDLHQDETLSSGWPYNGHLLRVAIIGVDILGLHDPETLGALVLHDSLENHAKKLIKLGGEKVPVNLHRRRKLAHVALSDRTTPKTGGFVRDLSNPILLPGQKKNPVYISHTRWLAFKALPESAAGKVADFLDNTWAHDQEKPEKRRKLDVKQEPIYDIHPKGMWRPDSLIVGEARMAVLAILEERHEEARRRLGYAAEDLVEQSA
jgi:(p)ppGpp synthase/HD superfamily hydrolase